MSLGCGDKAAAFTEVTAIAAAQRTDFIVNTAMITLKKTITMAKKKNHTNLPTNTAQYIVNGRRLHLVRGCGGMSSAKVSKLSTILSSLYLFSNMTWFSPSGLCRPNLSRLLPRSKFILDLLRRFRAVQVTTVWSAPMHSLAWYLSPRANARQAARVAFGFLPQLQRYLWCGSVDRYLEYWYTKMRWLGCNLCNYWQ